jgi:hypothetical protein
MTSIASLATRSIASGAICLAILGGMMAGHAWPLWTGTTIVLPLEPVDARDVFRGEYIRIRTPANRIVVGDDANMGTAGAVAVRPAGEWPWRWPVRGRDQKRLPRGTIAYVQLEPGPDRSGSPEYRPVSISLEPVEGAINLRGRVFPRPDMLLLNYGVDAYYMQEGRAQEIDEALRQGRRVQMEVAVTSSGRARIRTLLVDGVRVR